MEQNTPPQTNQNPYDFIVNGPDKLSKPKTGMKKRILVVGGGGLLLVIFIIIVLSLVLGGTKKDALAVYQVAATQQDIVELTSLGLNSSRDQQLLDFSSTVNSVVTTHKNDLSAYLSKGFFGKNSSNQIKAERDIRFKKTLESSKTSGTFDDDYQKLLANQLDLYRTRLRAAYSLATSQNLKNKLSQYSIELETISLKSDN